MVPFAIAGGRLTGLIRPFEVWLSVNLWILESVVIWVAPAVPGYLFEYLALHVGYSGSWCVCGTKIHPTSHVGIMGVPLVAGQGKKGGLSLRVLALWGPPSVTTHRKTQHIAWRAEAFCIAAWQPCCAPFADFLAP